MPSFKIKNMEKAWDRMPSFFKEDTNMAQINQPAKGTTPKCQQWKKQTNKPKDFPEELGCTNRSLLCLLAVQAIYSGIKLEVGLID